MSNKDTNGKKWLIFSQKSDATRISQNILSKALLVLLPVIVTFLLTQAYYARNVHYQVKIEAEKDLYINQMEIYNALLMIKKQCDTIHFKHESYVGKPKKYIGVDKFGNHIFENVVKDDSKVSFVDSTYSVPKFVCKKNLRAGYSRYIDILESNCMRLEPDASKKCNELLSIIANNPLPDCDSISVKSVIESGWTSIILQEKYCKLVKELIIKLGSKVERFTE